MQGLVAILEACVYLFFVGYSLYIPIQSYRNKKKLRLQYEIISNPSAAFPQFFSKAVLILSLPSIFVLWFFQDPNGKDDVAGISIYVSIFLVLMGFGFWALHKSIGDYYLTNEGIHFVRGEKHTIQYADIEEAKWRDYAHIDGASTTVTFTVRGERYKLYNLTKDQYIKYISDDNIYLPKREAEISIAKRIFTVWVSAITILSVLVFLSFIAYAGKYGGGSAVTQDENYSYNELLTNAAIPHYLSNHGKETEVPFAVWKNVLTIENIIPFMYILMFLSGFANIIWNNKIHRARYKNQ